MTVTSIAALVLYLATLLIWFRITSVQRGLWLLAGVCPMMLAFHCVWELNGTDPIFNSLFSLLTAVVGLMAALFVKNFTKHLP